MHSNRIHRIQRRAKRRFLVISLAVTAFAGYGALSLFGDDARPAPLPVAKMSITPAVKSVGIRLVDSGEKSAMTSDALAMQLPAQLPTRFPAPPSHVDAKLPTLLASPTPGPATTPAMDLSPAGSGFASLAAPPRMSESMVKSTSGKVVMRIGSDETSNDGLLVPAIRVEPSSTTPNPSMNGQTVDVRVVEPKTSAQPAKMPPFLVDSATKRAASLLELQPKPAKTPSAPVRISMADSDKPEQMPVTSVESRSSSPIKNRTPQLVKPKPTQIAHTVTLAQSTDLDSSSSMEQPADLIPPVDVDASLVPSSISASDSSLGKKAGVKAMLSAYSQSVVTDAVPDSFVSLSSPVKNSKPDVQRSETMSDDFLTRNTDSFGDDVVDSMRRRFDARLVSQAPIASVEIECLTATSMEIPGKLSAIAVQDEAVCKVLHNERSISLVGNSAGTTLVQVWTAELGSKPQMFRVNVSQGWGKVQATRTEVNDIKQVIARGFPRADVNIVTKEDGSLEVRGTTESEESAMRILELVRKLYLVPVKDKLTVSN